ncbi:MAG: MFS transporter [Acidimicrobiia bacterium]|nr:MFS transporter [Acidimicrobiia bacterium]
MRRLAAPLGFLAATRLVLNTGYRLVYPFLPAISRGLGVSVDRAGLLVSVRNLAGAATPVVVAAGRHSTRILIALAITLFALGAAIASATSAFWGAFAGFILMGLGKPAFDVGAMTYLADRTPYERRARYLATIELTWAGGLLVGAPVSGWLIDRFGWEAPFWLIAVLAGGALVLCFRLLEGARPGDGSPGAVPRLNRSARLLLIVFLLFSLAAELVFVVLGSWLEIEFGLTIIELGVFAAVVGFSELSGEGLTLLFADRVGKRNAIMIGIGVAITGFVAITLIGGSVAGGLAAAALAFLGFEITIVSALPFASEMQPAARSRYLGFIQVAMASARAVGALAGNPLFDAYGIAGNAGLAAVLNLAALVLVFRLIPEHA